MLVRLLPDQAAAIWPDIKEAINASLPPVVGMQGDRMSNILTSILTEEIIAWILVDKKEKSNDITAIALSSFTYDKPSGTKNLLIYSMYGYGKGGSGIWRDGMETARKFAKSQGCNRILAYTDVESLIELAESLGAETRYRLISFPI